MHRIRHPGRPKGKALVHFRHKPTTFDVFTALFLSQVSPPTCFILIAVFILNMYRSFWPFFQEGNYAWFALSLLVQFLLLTAVALAVSFTFVYGGSLLGLYKVAMSEQEVTLDDDFYQVKIGESETRAAIKIFLKFIETRKRIILIRSGLTASVIHKRYLSQENLAEFRRIFASKAAPKTQWYCRNFIFIALAMALVVGIFGSIPQYNLRLSSERPDAFWKGDRLYVTVRTVPEGFEDYFYWDLFPFLRAAQAKFTMPAVQLDLFEVAAGKLSRVPVTEEPFFHGTIFPIDDNLYYFGRGRKKAEKLLVLRNGNFEPSTDLKREDLRAKEFSAFSEEGGWKRLGLWDEEEGEEPALGQRNQDETATFHLASGDVKLLYHRKVLDDQLGVEEVSCQLTGLSGSPAGETLVDTKTDTRHIDRLTYLKYYPLTGQKLDLKDME